MSTQIDIKGFAVKTLNSFKTEKVLDVPICSPLFKQSVNFMHLKRLEKETSKESELDKITYEKQKILRSFNPSQLIKMKELVNYLEKNS